MRPEYRDEPCRTALTRVRKMSFKWSLNPYMGCVHQCTFCFVRAFEKLADRPADGRYGTSIRVKTNLVEVLTRELARRSWRREQVVVVTATDPYQPAEGRYRLTRACLGELARADTPFSIITRGPLVWRDVDVLQEAALRAEVSVNVSVPTLDDRVWRTTEPGTAPPRRRLEIVRRLVDAGIRTNVAVAPILPGLSDAPEQLAETVAAARAAGAHHIWANVLNLRPGTREHFLECLARDWPDERARYEDLYGDRTYLPREAISGVSRQVAALARQHPTDARPPLRPRPVATQLTLV
jgi:DNA repair photolyase